jgi:pSer/pThr/pTyr-binding forkhead associated (FHA) protein
MVENSQSQIEDLTDVVDVVDDGSNFPFRTERTPRDAIISSLDARPDLVETARKLVRVNSGPLSSASSNSAAGLQASSSPRADQNQAEANRAALDASAKPSPVLVVRTPGGTMETRFPIDAPRFLVGRENCDLELDDRFVARWHVQLFERNGGLILQDLNSRNGVYLRIADDLALEDGDQIVVGEQRFEFRTTWDSLEKRRDGDPDVLGASWAGSPTRLIRYIEGDQIGGIYPLGQRVTIGSRGTDICFDDDASLSPSHATIRRDNERFLLRDTDSESGTFIRIADAVELIEGDCFMVGRTRIRLSFS